MDQTYEWPGLFKPFNHQKNMNRKTIVQHNQLHRIHKRKKKTKKKIIQEPGNSIPEICQNQKAKKNIKPNKNK